AKFAQSLAADAADNFTPIHESSNEAMRLPPKNDVRSGWSLIGATTRCGARMNYTNLADAVALACKL
ncbi:MAG TPA: hypothetical protein VGH13_24140, partial [Xanthobacteraceae bacterium]